MKRKKLLALFITTVFIFTVFVPGNVVLAGTSVHLETTPEATTAAVVFNIGGVLQAPVSMTKNGNFWTTSDLGDFSTTAIYKFIVNGEDYILNPFYIGEVKDPGIIVGTEGLGSGTNKYEINLRVTYTVTYLEGDHGSLSGTAVTSGLSLGDPTPAAPTVIPDAHWEFSHWSPTPTATVEGDATYTAQYTAIPTYTVTYLEGDHGSLTGTAVTSGLYIGDATPAAPTVVPDSGWNFSHWSPTPTATVEGNATYTAQYTAIPTYTVTYLEGDHGSLTGTAVTSGLYIGDSTPAAPTVVPDAHWIFANWSPTPTALVEGNATYTAQYTPIDYTVRYEPGTQGTFTAQETTGLHYGDNTPTAPETPGTIGYTFTGWAPVPTALVTGNATYVAQWSQNEYTVRYEPGTQGTFTAQETTGLHYGDATPTAPATPGNTGYTFTGWSPVPSETVTGKRHICGTVEH